MRQTSPDTSVAGAFTEDSPWRLKAYRIAVRLIGSAQEDAVVLSGVRLYEPVARQLYRAVASIAANIAEGYSRSGGADRARFFEYALGSVRESLVWYLAARSALSADTVAARANRLVELRKLLLTSIRIERARKRIQAGRGQPPAPIST